MSNIYIDNSASISSLFYSCKSLTFIDISSFHRNKSDDLFSGIPQKGKIIVSNDYSDFIKKTLPNWDIFIR